MQSPVPTKHEITLPTPLQSLQERTHGSLQTIWDFMTDRASVAKQVAGDRVEIARAAKELLDRGDDVVELLLAKKASIDAAEVDHTIAGKLLRALSLFQDSLAQLRIDAAAVQVSSFVELSQNHEERLATFTQITNLLEERSHSIELSPSESDAITILQAKEGCAKLLGMSYEGLQAVRQNTLGAFVAAEAPQEGEPAGGQEFPEQASSAESHAASTVLERLQMHAHARWQAVNQAAIDRAEVAKAAKKILDEGGEAAAHAVVAKKAVSDAASIDKDIAHDVSSAIALFESSAALLKKAWQKQQCEDRVKLEELSNLSEEHEARASVYRQVADMIQVAAASAQLSEHEWDALAIVKVKERFSMLPHQAVDGVRHITARTAAACA
jgi:hypothetical protein